jgi:hypothetical protein
VTAVIDKIAPISHNRTFLLLKAEIIGIVSKRRVKNISVAQIYTFNQLYKIVRVQEYFDTLTVRCIIDGKCFAMHAAA